MNISLKIKCICCSVLFAPLLYANELAHRSMVMNASISSTLHTHRVNHFFPSLLKVETNPSKFTNSFGAFISNRPQTLVSDYDSYRSFDASPFYKLDQPRFATILNFNLDSNGTIISFGLDSGYKTKKLSVRPSLFLGATKTVKFSENILLLSAGAWTKSKINESPCIDDYEREYWCQNLTSWKDYQPKRAKTPYYIDLKFIRFF